MANRFWVGGTGTWDRTTTTHWATASNGAGGASAPGTGDVAIFDGSSGGGTVTVTWDTGHVTVQSITCGAFTGTLDFAASDNNVTLTAVAGMNASGAGTRTINLGDGTWTISGASGTPWNFATTTGLTFNANGSTIILSGASASQRTFAGGNLTYNAVQFAANASGGQIIVNTANTIGTLTITGQNVVQLPNGATQTVTTLALNGSSDDEILIYAAAQSVATISVAANAPVMTWAAFRFIACTGGATFAATSSFDLGANTGITITPPSGGAGGGILSNTAMDGGMN